MRRREFLKSLVLCLGGCFVGASATTENVIAFSGEGIVEMTLRRLGPFTWSEQAVLLKGAKVMFEHGHAILAAQHKGSYP